MSILPASCKWWRYPRKAPSARSLDHTRLRDKNRAAYPVRRFTKAECGAYVPERAKVHWSKKEVDREGWQFRRKGKRARADEARKLVLPGTWTFHGADKPYYERHTFTEAPKRKARRVRLSFREGWKPGRRQSLPAWRGPAKGKVAGTNFDWKPDSQHYFGAWEQQRFVRWTPTPRPIVTDFSHFLGQNSFLQHRVGGMFHRSEGLLQ
jgi:hypothetical protein